MSLPDLERRRPRTPLPDTADRIFRVGGTVTHALRTRTRTTWAAVRTGLATIRHWHPRSLRQTTVVPLKKSGSRPTACSGHDAIDPAATTAAVLDNRDRDRFDLWVDDELVGVLGYLDDRDIGANAPSDRRVVAFMHTVVAEDWTGKGLGAILVREAFAQAHSRNWTVRLTCPYAQHILTETKSSRSNLVDASTDLTITAI